MKTNQEILKKNLPDISVYLILGLLLSFLKILMPAVMKN